MKLLLTALLTYMSVHCFSQITPTKVDIPMADGKSLAGDLYLPDPDGKFPTILIMTPYGKFFYARNGLPLGIGDDISSSNYAFLIVDWRCRFASLSACAAGSDNGEDGYDVVEWAAAQDWSDGKIGTWGPSALGSVQFQIARNQPPHLVCSVPEVTAPQFAFQRYYPGGSLTTERLETLTLLFPGSFNIVLRNPHYNILWSIAENGSMYPADIEVPMLLIGGWFDLNIDQTIIFSDTLASSSPAADQHKTLIGPWVHGGTGQAVVGSEVQGDLSFPEAKNRNVIAALEFFDFHLRGIANNWDERPRYTYFQMGQNTWESASSWPPPGSVNQTFYLQADNSLQPNDPPSSSNASLKFQYDPEDPSPTHGGKTLNLGLLQGPYDQSQRVESRGDQLTFTTSELGEDLSVSGKIRLNLFVSSDREDTDFAVRLTEVYPDGRSILLSDQIQRMRFRNGYREQDVAFLEPGVIYEVPLILEDLAITFQKGNRIRIIISSSNYPRYNRNMNTGGEMYPDNNIDTLVGPLVATNTIYTNASFPSSLTLPVTVDFPVGVAESRDASLINLYPNPAGSRFAIESKTVIRRLFLYAADGQLVRHSAPVQRQVQLKAGELAPGIYILKLELDNGKMISKKLVIRATDR